jgi:branched-chain amino acid transport system permease protein
MLTQFLANGLITGMIYGLVALGFALVYNTTKIFHIAYAAIYMIAPYFLFHFINTYGLDIYSGVILAIILTAVVGVLTDVLVYYPLAKKKSSANVMMIGSIGIMIIIINFVAMYWGNETKILNPEISKTYSWNDIIITKTQIIQFLVSLVVVTGFLLFLKLTKFGIKIRAYRDDAQLVEIMGTNTRHLRIVLFALSSVFAAIAGCLVSYDVGMTPHIGMPMLLNGAVALIIGGVGKFHAPVFGGLLIGLLQAMVVYITSARWQDAVTFTLLILFLLLRPQGILGEKNRKI